jgi:hypothetical protein
MLGYYHHFGKHYFITAHSVEIACEVVKYSQEKVLIGNSYMEIGRVVKSDFP